MTSYGLDEFEPNPTGLNFVVVNFSCGLGPLMTRYDLPRCWAGDAKQYTNKFDIWTL